MTDVASASIGVAPVPLARDIEEGNFSTIEAGRDLLGLSVKDVEPAAGVNADAKHEELATSVRGSSFVEGEDKGDKATFEEKDVEKEPEDNTIANGLEAKTAIEPETTMNDAKDDAAAAAVISTEETEQPAIDGETPAAPRVVSEVVVDDGGERATAPEHATQPLTEVEPKAKDEESTVGTPIEAEEDSPESPSVGDVEVTAKEEDPIEVEEVTQSQAVEEHVQAPSAEAPAKEEEPIKIGEIEDEQAVEETSKGELPTAEETEDKPGLEVKAETEAPKDVEEPSKEELINAEDVPPAAEEGKPTDGQEPTETKAEVTNDVKNTEAAAAKPDAVEDLTAGEHPIPAEQEVSAPVVAAEIVPAASEAELQASESVPDVKPKSEEVVQPVVKEVEAGVLAPVAETYVKDEATDTKTSSESGVESLSSVPTETDETPSVAPDEHTAPSIPEEAVEEETDAIKEPEAVHVLEEVEEKPQVELTGAIPVDNVNASLPEPEEADKSVDSQVVEREAVLEEEPVDAATSLEAQAGETDVEVLAPEDAIVDGSKPEETSEATKPEKVAVEQPTDVATSVDATLVDNPEVKAPVEGHLLSSDNVKPEEKDDTPVTATTLPSDETAEAPSEVVEEAITGAPEESEVSVLAEEVKETHTAPPDVSVEPIAEETPAVATNEVGGPTEGPSDEAHVKEAAPPVDEAVESESNKQGEPIPAESQEDVPVEKEKEEPHVRGLEDESKSHQADITALNEEKQDTSEAITEQAIPDGEATLAEEPTTVEPAEAIQVQPATEPIQQHVSEAVDVEETTPAGEPATTEPTEAIKEEPATDVGQQDVSEIVIDEAVSAEEPAPATIELPKVDELATEPAQLDVSESIGAGVNDGEDTLAEEPATSVPAEAVEESATESVQQDASESVNDDPVNVAEPTLAEVEPVVSVDEPITAPVQQDVSESIIDEAANAGETTLAEASRTTEPSEAIEESAKTEPTEVIEEPATEPLQQDVSESIIDETVNNEESALTGVEPAEVNDGESTTELVQQGALQPTVDEAGDVGKVILVEAPATTEPEEAIEEPPEESSQEVLASEIQATESEEPLVEPSTDAETGQVGSTEVEIPVSVNAQGPLEDEVQKPSSTGQAEEARPAGEEPAEPVIAKTLEDPVALPSDDKAEHVTELVQEETDEHPNTETTEVEPEVQVAPAEEVPIEQESVVLQEPAAIGNADVADEASVPAVVAADVAASAPGGIITGLQEENEGTELHVEDDRSIADAIVTKEVQVEEQVPTSREVLEGTEQVSVAVEESEVAREDTDIHAEAAGETEVQIVGPDEGHPVELAEHVGEGAQDPGLLDEPIPNVQVELPTPSSQTLSLTSEEDDQETEVPLEHRLAEAIGIPAEEIAKLPALSSLESSEVIASTFEEETTTPTDTKVQTITDETQGKEETLADEPKDSDALAKSLHSEQPSIIETFETETNTVPDDRSADAEVPDRPKSPWAPSYSVTTQGSSPVHPPEEEQIAKELDVYPTESVPQSTMEPVVETAPVPTEAIVPPSDATPLIDTQTPEPVTEGDVQAVPKKDDALTDEEEALVGVAPAATLSVDTGVKEVPERPKSPWTPSYTVTMQGPGIPEPEELVLDAEPDLAGAVEEKGEAIQVTPPADDIPVSAQEIERPKSPYPPSYSVTQMGPGLGEENGVLNEAEEVGSVVSSNDPEAPSTPRSDLGAITPSFDSRSEVSESSDVPIAPSSPRSDPEVTSLAEEVKTPLALGAEDHGTPISPLHTPLSSADKTLEGDSEGEPEVAELLTELAVSGFNGDRNANQTTVTGSWIKATDNERDTQVPESEASHSEDAVNETVIQGPELSEETKPSVTTIPKLDITVAPPTAQPVIVTNSLSTDSAYTQMSDSLSPSQETGTNVTTPDVDTFSISKGSDVESIEPLDEETVSHFSDSTRTPTGPEAGAKPLGVAQTLAMRSFPSAFSNNGADNLTSADQSKQAPVVESLEVNDQLSLLSSRRRLESTVSSLAFPGGWVSTPPQKERPSLEFATGEFSRPIIDGTPVPPAVAPAVVAEASPEKESKWRCIIM